MVPLVYTTPGMVPLGLSNGSIESNDRTDLLETNPPRLDNPDFKHLSEISKKYNLGAKRPKKYNVLGAKRPENFRFWCY